MTTLRLSTLCGLRAICLLTVLSTMLLSAQASYAQDQATEVVGEITTVIGQGVISNLTGGERPITRGQHIRSGDRIETAEGGHVHIRFVDGGLVSVRPLSRLVVEEYRNATGNDLAAIKFRLEDGVIRSVTGRWGEANRERFRLNTPIAAIGVKGTDFVVKAEQGKTSASVLSGAIVMTPLEGSCVSTLGTCQSEKSALLSAEMQGQMLEYLQQNGGGVPRLVPMVDLMVRNGITPLNQLRRGEALASVEKVISNSDSMAGDALGNSDQSSQQSSPSSPQSKPLVWLHNVFGWNVPEHTISERDDPDVAAGRTPVIGNFFISLYRDETQQSEFKPPQSSASFRLTSASANFSRSMAYGMPVEPVAVSNATLNVDFANATFATQMQLNSPSLGQSQFDANGKVSAKGVFLAQGAGQSLSGAFSTNAQQAGYLFHKNVAGGKVSGLTLWGR